MPASTPPSYKSPPCGKELSRSCAIQATVTKWNPSWACGCSANTTSTVKSFPPAGRAGNPSLSPPPINQSPSKSTEITSGCWRLLRYAQSSTRARCTTRSTQSSRLCKPPLAHHSVERRLRELLLRLSRRVWSNLAPLAREVRSLGMTGRARPIGRRGFALLRLGA